MKNDSVAIGIIGAGIMGERLLTAILRQAAPVFAAAREIFSPALRRILWKSIGLTIALLVLVWLGLTKLFTDTLFQKSLINTFAWVFYLFGLVLLLTAGHMLRSEGEESHSADNVVVRLARRVLPATEHYDGDKLFTVVEGKRVMTPMVLVMVAIAGTDLLFALDSIPAIFGLTQEVYLVFTATAFSLLGLRQLYFLIDGLLDRLIYLSYGLAAILVFIGVKLMLHALHENNVPFINDGEPVPVVEISTAASLSVIVGLLAVTVLASLFSKRGLAHQAIGNARRHATSYLDAEYTMDAGERERIFHALVDEHDRIVALGPRFRRMMADEPALMDLLERAIASHDEAIERNEAEPVSPTLTRRGRDS